ncbi:MAG: hypothetical protein MUE88_02995 [Flavobacteriales bacterium]|nr:hypothetical protein [Flavobacteriales bacterium]
MIEERWMLFFGAPFEKCDLSPMQGQNDLVAADIAWHMYQYAAGRGHAWITPNTILYDWESDLLTVTPEGFVCEIEIKVSRSDLAHDLEKPKHKAGILLNGMTASPASVPRSVRTERQRPVRPNFFCFALPCSVFRGMQRNSLPPYAGIYTVDDAGRVFEEKRPILLHDQRIASSDLLDLARRMHARYWGQIARARGITHQPHIAATDAEDRGIDRA